MKSIWKKNFLFGILFFCLILNYTPAQPNSPSKGSDLMENENWHEARGRWISRDSIVWQPRAKGTPPNQGVYTLHWHPTGDIQYKNHKIQVGPGGASYELPYHGSVKDGYDTENDQKLAYLSYLKGRSRLQTGHLAKKIQELLQGALVIAWENDKGILLDASHLQTAGILDDLYTYQGDLGVVFDQNEGNKNKPSFYLWAPTAKSVQLHLYENSERKDWFLVEKMSPLKKEGKWTGVWHWQGEDSLQTLYYRYEVEVYVRSEGQVKRNLVTDPYSASLSLNSHHSQILNLKEDSWKPEGWDYMTKPSLNSFQDISIYELHVRDFSITDSSVPENKRGTFLAFEEPESLGVKHLRALANSGLTHIHLLPIFDIATIEENRSLQKVPSVPKNAPADSPTPQKEVDKVKDQDGFNWGYDPYHYMVPEGSYAVEGDGENRILETRRMVKALQTMGLRVIMDVVYNHTHQSGQGERSVFDKIVPGYYYRLNDEGYVQSTTCCPDTATEHRMMEKLMIDTLLWWACQYKIDGFRFDLMGHHTRTNMIRVRQAFDQLTLEKDGVDGKKIYVYGEGWRFGSLDAILPNEAFHQQNTYGCKIGSFNDRIRDSARGGSPFSDLAAQGFINGLYYDFNQAPENKEIPHDLVKQKAILLNQTDNLRLALVGHLRDYVLTNAKGKKVKGSEIEYRGSKGSGYSAQATEIINYISVHDNHTLWDCIQARAPFQTPNRQPMTATLKERVRMHNLGLSLIALGQPLPIFHAGVDMLRSKSGDTDSYNSGDWFNRLDFSYQENNWGVGLPIAEKNKNDWDFWKERLANFDLKPQKEHILQSVHHFQELLQIRCSLSPFRFNTPEELQKRTRFCNGEKGPEQIPGLIVMEITCPEERKALSPWKKVVLVFNAKRNQLSFSDKNWVGEEWSLHPVQQKSYDGVVQESTFDSEKGSFLVPERTCAVFVCSW